ncbi:MAG: DUF5710 domain-containing protein [Streptosporangiaceae bacterium]
MRHWLDVPYGQRDLAKRCGARWDNAAVRWYAPQPGMHGLARWEPLPDLLPGEDRSFGSGLFVDAIPSTTWFKNARTNIARGDWQRVRMLVLRRAGYRCEACGQPENRQAGRILECHERWHYDAATQTQQLRRLVAFCASCHGATHFGLAQIQGRADEAIEHLLAVTGMSSREADAHIDAARLTYERRSRIPWTLDLSMLTEAGIALADGSHTAGPRPEAAGRARILHTPPAARTAPIPIAAQPKPAGLGSRWERWLQAGER